MSVFVIDDHPLMRDAIVMLIRRQRPSLDVVELGSLAEVGQAIADHGSPELVCLDLKLPDAQGTEGIQRLRQWLPDTSIIVLSASPAADVEAPARAAGADAYVEKSAGALVIGKALRDFLAEDGGEEPSAPAVPEKLSRRQQQLLTMIDQGLSNREIAEALDISEHTVKVHLWRLFRRLNVKSRSQASHLARTSGLLMGS